MVLMNITHELTYLVFSVREKSLGSFQKDFFSACVDQVGYSFAFIIESCSLFGLFFYLGLGMQGH